MQTRAGAARRLTTRGKKQTGEARRPHLLGRSIPSSGSIGQGNLPQKWYAFPFWNTSRARLSQTEERESRFVAGLLY